MRSLGVLVIMSIVIVSLGFVTSGYQTEKEYRKSILVGKAKKIKTEIDFPSGTLNITSSTKHLSEGVYKFYRDKWKPKISYEDGDLIGNMKIVAIDGESDNNYDDLDQSHWDVTLNRTIKNRLTIKFNAGKGDINLNTCDLDKFDFVMGAGDVNINLSNSSVPIISFKALAGNAVIDLTGKWHNDLKAILEGGVGEITLKLPAQTGTKLIVHGFLGEVKAPGLKKQGDTYTNSLFGKTKEELYIDLTVGVGTVNVELVN